MVLEENKEKGRYLLLGVGREQGERETSITWCWKIAKEGDICHLVLEENKEKGIYLSHDVGR